MRIEKRETIETLQYPSVSIEITHKDGRVTGVLGYLKGEKTGLPTELIFTTEDRLGELVDDLSEALDEIRRMKKGNNDD